MAGEVKKLLFADGVTVSSPSDLLLGAAEPPQKNLVINGGFDFWQRQVTSTTDTTSTYRTADRYITRAGGGAAGFQQTRATDVPSNGYFKYSMNMLENGDATANSIIVMNRIEARDVKPYIGKTMTASFWVKKNAISMPDLNLSIITPVSATEDSWNADLTVDTLEFFVKPSLTDNTWTQVELSFVVPANAANGIAVQLGSGSYTGVAEIWTTGWMLNEGSAALSTFTRAGNNMQDEFAMCQRFYQKSYSEAVVPGSVSSPGRRISSSLNPTSNANNDWFRDVQFTTAMRNDSPSATIYSSLVGTSGFVSMFDVVGAATVEAAGTIQFVNRSAMDVRVTTVGANTAGGTFQWVVEAEL